MSQKAKNLIGGVSILGIVGLICKIVGVLYRIPLAQAVGAKGMAIYQQVFPSYNLLLTISSAGIPVAISRMVAHCLAQNDPRNAKRVFTASMAMLTVLGVVSTAFLMLFSGNLATAAGTSEAQRGFLAIAPSLLFVCVMSAFRGSMQGRRRMAPTGISQLIEQVGKVFIALPFASLLYQTGGTEMERAALGAAGALLGTSIAEALALLYMGVRHLMGRKELDAVAQDESREVLGYRYLCGYIIRVAIPITIGACIVPLANTIDSFMLVNIMEGYLGHEEALVRYGVFSALVLPLINVPTAIAMAMSINLVPSIASSLAKKDRLHIRRESATGLRLASLVGLPCSVGMSMLAFPILSSLYARGGKFTPEQLQLGAELLTFSALTIVLFTMVQATSGILQGMRKQRIPMYTLVAGVVCKVALNYTLVRIPGVNIHGAPFASLLCYTVSMVPNLYYVCKHTGLVLSLDELLIRPGLATAAMATAVWLLKTLIGADRLGHSLTLVLIVILLAMAVYLAAALLFKAIKQEDIPRRLRKFLPKRLR